MSTYTDLHCRAKENITISRMPGNPYDGTTGQRVIFANPENIYYGTFCGTLSNFNAEYRNITLNECTINDSMLSNVTFKHGDETIELTTLTANYAQISNEISAFFKDAANMLIYKGGLLIDYIDSSYERTLPALLSTNGIAEGTPLSAGYLFIATANNKQQKYIYSGVELGYSDWIMVSSNCYSQDIASSDVVVLNSQDYDVFKCLSNNIAIGNNEFKGKTTLSTAVFNGNATFQKSLIAQNSATFLSGLSANSISSNAISVNSAKLGKLNIELSNIEYSISSMQDLSNDIYQKINRNTAQIDELSGNLRSLSSYSTSVALSIAELNKDISELSSNAIDEIAYLSSEISDYHNTLSGIDRLNDVEHDIQSDNLIITDALLPGGSEHHHKRYYMTFLSGTIVLKQIQEN